MFVKVPLDFGNLVALDVDIANLVIDGDVQVGVQLQQVPLELSNVPLYPLNFGLNLGVLDLEVHWPFLELGLFNGVVVIAKAIIGKVTGQNQGKGRNLVQGNLSLGQGYPHRLEGGQRRSHDEVKNRCAKTSMVKNENGRGQEKNIEEREERIVVGDGKISGAFDFNH